MFNCAEQCGIICLILPLS